MSECSASLNTEEIQEPDKNSTPPPPFDNSSEKDKPGPSRSDQAGNEQRKDLNRVVNEEEGGGVEEEEEEEDEDVDFNPLLREAHSVEASLSLSSDVEDVDVDVADSGANASVALVEDVEEKRGDCVGGGCGNEDGEDILTDVSNVESSRKGVVDVESEGAIWMRTRARYSLASFTLDELETFLQETDDEDDLPNVDDEEEYRKFLAAVLMGDGSESLQENVNAEDDDEENDADFELELEEALESDPDEIEVPRTSRRNRRQKAALQSSKKLSEQVNRPLRPLLPFAPLGSFSAFGEDSSLPNSAPSSLFTANNAATSGFTPHQIGQLHSLIHEHVQLLLQIFSVSVLDPSKAYIAAREKDLILEMLKNRDQMLTSRTVPYPSFCICGPVLSVTDVAPLRLAGQYINDVDSAVRAHKRRQIEIGLGTCVEKEPLFPFHILPYSTESDDQGGIKTPQGGIKTPQDSSAMVPSPSKNHLPKKTMAAALVEKAKTQSVALVPKEIATLAQRFWPLFNPALYPHKPPPPSIANRVLFTDAEDELLALGLMEYNTDWKAIQQRFLPCKSKHQIFVRQKNRASAKAPENPVKAVRRMKNSPLTSEEIALIEAGLKKFKLDWISIWRFVVPYRDPSLLPRQWRIACGTQKSYKADAEKKAKRRLHAAKTKATKPSSSTFRFSSGKEHVGVYNSIREANSRDDYIEKQDEAYVHEAFLSDWRPDSSVASSGPSSLPSEVGSKAGELKENLKSCNSQTPIRPYRARRPNPARVVKLAPDLPPVNLPPSVRIMPQSAFRNCGTEVSTKVPSNASKHPEVSIEKSVAERRDNSEHQMHPLFLQTLQDGRLPYYPPKYGSSSSSSTFLLEKQPQLNLSLFHNPRHIRDAVTYLSKSSKPSEKNSSSDVDFHPLLHSTDPLNVDLATRMLHNADSRQRCISIENSFCADMMRKSSVDDGSSASGGKMSSLGGKVKGLQLDINLNVASNDQNIGGTNNTALSCTDHSVTAISDCIIAKDSLEKKDSAPNEVDDKLEARDLPLDALRNNENTKVAVSVHDESLSEIIMEQEELSDSDEEFEENVEFEHEEMADSGDDTSDSEQVVDIPNEEVPVDEMDADIDSQILQTEADCEENTCAPLDAGLELRNSGDNARPSVLSLNLNSHPPVSPLSNPKDVYDYGPFGTTGEVDKSQYPSSSRRSSRSKREKDASNQLSVGFGNTSVRKQRKRVCRPTPNSSIAGSGKVRLISGMDLNVDSPKTNVETER